MDYKLLKEFLEGSDCRFMLILNKLLKILDAQNYQKAGNEVLEYATSTRDFRRLGFALGRCARVQRAFRPFTPS